MKTAGFILLLFISVFSFAQKAKTTVVKPVSKKTVVTAKIPKDVQVWTVDAQRAKCEGATTMQCLLVKKPGDKDFNLFYENIQGFDYKEGFVYTLWVKAEAIDRMTLMIGDPEIKYTLAKIVSKKPITGYTNTTIDNKKPLSGMNVTLTKTLIINEEKGQCEGNPDAKCLLIKKEGAKEFELFYQDIEGFKFEEGYRQTILVNERHIANPMVKQTEPIYTLVSVLKKEFIYDAKKLPPVVIDDPKTPLDKKWFLRKMQESDTTSFIIDDNIVYIEINSTESRINGKAPCNTFIGGLTSDFNSSFQSSAIVNTKMYCSNIKMENLFFTFLQNADRFEINSGKLSLYKGKRLLLIFE